MSVWAILVAAGSGERLGLGIPKALVPLHGNDPLFLSSLPALTGVADGVVIVFPSGHRDSFERWLPETAASDGARVSIRLIEGGPTRQTSVAAGLAVVPDDADRIFVHDAARPFLAPELLQTLLGQLGDRDGILPAAPIHDTLKRVQGDVVVETAARERFVTAETPQLFRASVLRAAHAMGGNSDATDDAALVESAGGRVGIVRLPERGLKITTAADLAGARERFSIIASSGSGFDAHPLVEGRPLTLGTVTIPFERGPEGHSDGDAVAHAICDALFGAARLGDIGDHFPSGDERWRGATGATLLAAARRILEERVSLTPAWVDATVILQAPAIAPHREAMRRGIADALGIEPSLVSVKATTTDRLGIIGSGAGVAAQATVGLSRSS